MAWWENVGGSVAAVAIAAIGSMLLQRPRNFFKRLLSGKPIAVEVQTLMEDMSDINILMGPVSFVFPTFNPLEEEKLPTGIADWQSWAYDHGGEDVQTSLIQVTLQGLSADATSIEVPQLVAHEVSTRLCTQNFGPGGLGGGAIAPRHYTFTLNGVGCTADYWDPENRARAFELGAGDTERILIKVDVTDSRRHEWLVRVPYIRRGRRKYLIVKPSKDRSFVTNGAEGLVWWGWNGHWYGGTDVV